VRACVAGVLEVTCQSLSAAAVRPVLNLAAAGDDAAFKAFCDARKWTIDGTYVDFNAGAAADKGAAARQEIIPLDQIAKILANFA
jgi:hypothetical protein